MVLHMRRNVAGEVKLLIGEWLSGNMPAFIRLRRMPNRRPVAVGAAYTTAHPPAEFYPAGAPTVAIVHYRSVWLCPDAGQTLSTRLPETCKPLPIWVRIP